MAVMRSPKYALTTVARLTSSNVPITAAYLRGGFVMEPMTVEIMKMSLIKHAQPSHVGLVSSPVVMGAVYQKRGAAIKMMIAETCQTSPRPVRSQPAKLSASSAALMGGALA